LFSGKIAGLRESVLPDLSILDLPPSFKTVFRLLKAGIIAGSCRTPFVRVVDARTP
jgi:hypothetical protein